MTLASITLSDLADLLDEEILGLATSLLRKSGDVVRGYDTDGDDVGLVYFASETRLHYAADLDDCRALITRHIAARDDHGPDGDEHRATVYSLWCSATSLVEGETPRACADAAGWSCPSLGA